MNLPMMFYKGPPEKLFEFIEAHRHQWDEDRVIHVYATHDPEILMWTSRPDPRIINATQFPLVEKRLVPCKRRPTLKAVT